MGTQAIVRRSIRLTRAAHTYAQKSIYNYEGGGASALLGVAFHPVPTLADGTNRIEDIREGECVNLMQLLFHTTHKARHGGRPPLPGAKLCGSH